jgi:hypothetical protein
MNTYFFCLPCFFLDLYIRKLRSLLFLSFRILRERLPEVVFTQGEEVRVAHATHVGRPPVSRLVARYIQNAHLGYNDDIQIPLLCQSLYFVCLTSPKTAPSPRVT